MARKYLDTTGLTALWAKIVAKINSAGDAFVKKVGDTISGQLSFSNTSRNIQVPARSISYVDGAKGNAGIYMPHEYDKDQWGPIFCVQNKAGGSWSVGSYNGEDLEFVNFTKANIDSSTNSARCNWKLSPTNGFVGPWNGVTDEHSINNTTDTWVPVYNNGKLQHRVLSATLNNKTVTDASSVHNLPGYSADNIPTTKYMAYWNGAYNSSGNSNLRYTSVGELKSAATKDAINNANYTSVNYGIDRNLAYSVTGAAITCSHSRTKHENWTNKFTLICPRNSSVLGTLICNTGSSWSHFYIVCSGNPSSWSNIYNGGISNMSSTYPTLAVTNTTIDGVAYSVATWTSRAGNMTWHAEYTISNVAAP